MSLQMQKTLDSQHHSKMRAFERAASNASVMNAKLSAVNAKLASSSQQRSQDLDAYLACSDEVSELTRSLSRNQLSNDELSYYLDVGTILFKYYDRLESGYPQSSLDACGDACGGKSILTFFAKKVEDSVIPSALPSADKSAAESSSVEQVSSSSRATLLDMYLSHVDADYMRPDPPQEDATTTGACPHCGSRARVAMMHEGFTVCEECHSMENLLVDHDKPSYKDPPKEVTLFYCYKRINHFNEWLSQIQGKETTDIPDEVYDRILLEIKKQKITNMADITAAKVKEILKKMRGNKYYEHISHILSRLNGLPVPHLSPDLEDRLRHMFCQIQVPFLKHSPKGRKNFLSYSYVLHKFMQLLEYDEYLPSFPLLKSRMKLYQCDLVWEKICNELGWQFLKSL